MFGHTAHLFQNNRYFVLSYIRYIRYHLGSQHETSASGLGLSIQYLLSQTNGSSRTTLYIYTLIFRIVAQLWRPSKPFGPSVDESRAPTFSTRSRTLPAQSHPFEYLNGQVTFARSHSMEASSLPEHISQRDQTPCMHWKARISSTITKVIGKAFFIYTYCAILGFRVCFHADQSDSDEWNRMSRLRFTVVAHALHLPGSKMKRRTDQWTSESA